MKHQWYGDNRDIVKWGTLVTLCKRYDIQRILHVAMLTEDQPTRPLKCDQDCEIPREVWDHFRRLKDLSNIATLVTSPEIHIEVLEEPFTHAARKSYFEKVVASVQALECSAVVFLDPDTGIEPGNLTEKHVSCDEIGMVWRAIKPSSCLVVYQHAQHEAHWQTSCREKFSKACAGTKAEPFESEVAKDVAFFAARQIAVAAKLPESGSDE